MSTNAFSSFTVQLFSQRPAETKEEVLALFDKHKLAGQYERVEIVLRADSLFVSFAGLRISPQVIYNILNKADGKTGVQIVNGVPGEPMSDITLFCWIQALVSLLLLLVYAADQLSIL